MTNKYAAITKLLLDADARGERELTVTFEKLDTLVPGGLPPSARKHRAWWSNSSQHASRAWAPWGWVVDTVNQSTNGWVRFRRIALVRSADAEGPRPPPAAPAAPAPKPEATEESPSTPAACGCNSPSAAPASDTDVHLLVPWIYAGQITVDATGRLDFPALPALPGVYRIELYGAPGQSKPRVYVGETDLLFRRMVGYRTPGPSQSTNIMLNNIIAGHLRAGGKARLLVATSALVQVGGRDQPLLPLDLSRKSSRTLVESAALLEAHTNGDDVANAAESMPRIPAA